MAVQPREPRTSEETGLVNDCIRRDTPRQPYHLRSVEAAVVGDSDTARSARHRSVGSLHGAVARSSVFLGVLQFRVKTISGAWLRLLVVIWTRQGIEMRISSDQKIAGYPAIRVRELMRRTAGGPITFRDVRRILQCSDTAAARVFQDLEKDGLIVSVDGSMEPSRKGNALAMATAAPPLRRATASRLVADLIKRTCDLNADDTWAYRVRRIVVFGSYVRGSDRPNDVDFACDLCPRWKSDRQRAEEQVRRRSRGAPFRDVLQWATWPRLEVYRYLRARSRGLSIHELEDWILQDADHHVVYEATSSKCNLTENSTASQTSGRR